MSEQQLYFLIPFTMRCFTRNTEESSWGEQHCQAELWSRSEALSQKPQLGASWKILNPSVNAGVVASGCGCAEGGSSLGFQLWCRGVIWLLIVVDVFCLEDEESQRVQSHTFPSDWCSVLVGQLFSPSARLAWCCPQTQSRWPRVHWGSRRSLRSWLCGHHEWTEEAEIKSDLEHHQTHFSVITITYQKLWWAVLSVLWRLLLPNFTENRIQHHLHSSTT